MASRKRSNKRTDSGVASQTGRAGRSAGALLGVVATILAVALSLNTIGNLLTDRSQQRATYMQLLATVDQQYAERKYDLAWIGIEKAAEQREAQAWKLRGLPTLDDVHAKEADVAAAWLRDIRLIGEDKTFTAIVERLEPALQREAVQASGIRKADLIAHLGYADFLRTRDGDGHLDPATRYDEAIGIDSDNPFALAMLGHWRLWNGGSVADSAKLFEQALATKREGAFVRRMQLSAFGNRREDDADFAFLRALNEMRVSGEPIDDASMSHADGIYYFHGDPSGTDALLHAMPPSDHLALVRFLAQNENAVDKKRRYDHFAALLEQASGDRPLARGE
jgi:hypothetical protein